MALEDARNLIQVLNYLKQLSYLSKSGVKPLPSRQGIYRSFSEDGAAEARSYPIPLTQVTKVKERVMQNVVA